MKNTKGGECFFQSLYICKYTNNGVATNLHGYMSYTAVNQIELFNQSDEVQCEFGLFVYEHLNRFDSKMASLRA